MRTTCMVKGHLILSECKGITAEGLAAGTWQRVVSFRFLDLASGLGKFANDNRRQTVKTVAETTD